MYKKVNGNGCEARGIEVTVRHAIIC